MDRSVWRTDSHAQERNIVQHVVGHCARRCQTVYTHRRPDTGHPMRRYGLLLATVKPLCSVLLCACPRTATPQLSTRKGGPP